MEKEHLKTSFSFIWKMNTDQLAELSFILFFSDKLLRAIFTKLLGSNMVSIWLGILLPYVPLAMLLLKNPRKYIKLDFLAIMAAVLVFFAVTWLIHPEYTFDYTRADFGIWDHVLKPYRGIYAYLFIRLIGEPKRIYKCMKISGWVMMIYFIYRVSQGNWTTVGESGYIHGASYSVAFGYEVLIFALIFLYAALTERKLAYYIASIVDITMILICGSRGPILFLGLFFVLYLLIYVKNSRKKILAIILSLAGIALVYIFYIPAMTLLINLFSRFGISSRFLMMLLSGNISDDNNRLTIWSAAIQMIKENPFGYGAMGSRYVIRSYIFAGYPHSIILEFLIDYGVFLGTGLLIFLFQNAFSILFSKIKTEWCGIFLPFFCSACSLFISLTYWSIPAYWSCLALGVCCYSDVRQKRKSDWQMQSLKQ